MLVVGPTGYIGKFVAKELIARGYKVVVFAREKSGVGGKASRDQTIKVRGFTHTCVTNSFHTWFLSHLASIYLVALEGFTNMLPC